MYIGTSVMSSDSYRVYDDKGAGKCLQRANMYVSAAGPEVPIRGRYGKRAEGGGFQCFSAAGRFNK